MRLGLIARADNSGLGTQTWGIYRHLKPVKTLVIDVGHLHNNTDHSNKSTHLDRYPDGNAYKGWEPTPAVFRWFLKDIDVALSCETFYSWSFPDQARAARVKTVLAPNFEFLSQQPVPDLYAAPSMWRYSEIPDKKVFLPVPIETDRFQKREPRETARHFVHIVGRPAVLDRNGTPELLASLRHVESEIKLTLKSQHAKYLHNLVEMYIIPPNVELEIDSTDVTNYWENYAAGDVMILPRKFGGLCLPANEAVGAGMPVIMTDVSPNNTWLPQEWLVPAVITDRFCAGTLIDAHSADTYKLARKIDQFAQDRNFYSGALQYAQYLSVKYSWETLRPEYDRVLSQ